MSRLIGNEDDRKRMDRKRIIDGVVNLHLKKYVDGMKALSGLERVHGVPVNLALVAMIVCDTDTNLYSKFLGSDYEKDEDEFYEIASVLETNLETVLKTKRVDREDREAADELFCTHVGVYLVELRPRVDRLLQDVNTKELLELKWKNGYSDKMKSIGRIISARTKLKNPFEVSMFGELANHMAGELFAAMSRPGFGARFLSDVIGEG